MAPAIANNVVPGIIKISRNTRSQPIMSNKTTDHHPIKQKD
jgi:hypothetical protein